jgi:hypothetical protein
LVGWSRSLIVDKTNSFVENAKIVGIVPVGSEIAAAIAVQKKKIVETYLVGSEIPAQRKKIVGAY